MPKAFLVLAAALLFALPAHAERDFSTIEPDAVCGDIALYDFDSVIDGPIYYVDLKTFRPICRSGGACRGASRNSAQCKCPENVWPCPYPDAMALHDKKVAERRSWSDTPIVCGSIKYFGGNAALGHPGIYTDGTTGVLLAKCGGKRVYSREPANCPPAGWTCPNPAP